MSLNGMSHAEMVAALKARGIPHAKAEQAVTRKLAAFGVSQPSALPRKRPAKLTKPQDATTALFLAVLKAVGLPHPVPEWRFARPRKWAFDFAWPLQKVALEVEGGIWTRGRHTQGTGYKADMEKYSRAAILGWRLYRTTPDELTSQATLDALCLLLNK
jgi:hypothetical protein